MDTADDPHVGLRSGGAPELERVVSPGDPAAGGNRVNGHAPRLRVSSRVLVLNAGYEPINARVETVASKRPFAELVARPDRRCLVVADGWYEWLREERPRGTRTPFRYTVDGGEPFAFAGLWDERRVGGEHVASVTVLTTAANAVCLPVHDRMPCVLESPEAEAAWLSPDLDAAAAVELLAPLDPGRTSTAPANPAVNRAGVEGPELLVVPEAEEEPAQLRLV